MVAAKAVVEIDTGIAGHLFLAAFAAFRTLEQTEVLHLALYTPRQPTAEYAGQLIHA